MSSSKSIDHSGSTFDSFLEEEHLLEDTEAIAIKRVIAWQLQKAMKAKRVTKRAMAQRLKTSRSQVDRLLDPAYVGTSLETVSRAACAVGKRVRVQLVEVNGQMHQHSQRFRTNKKTAAGVNPLKKASGYR
jgi:predicted XRE-type DNA-binding protein